MGVDSYFEAVARREARRRRQARTGIVVILALVAVGWFMPDPVSYAVGVILAVVFGLIARREA